VYLTNLHFAQFFKRKTCERAGKDANAIKALIDWLAEGADLNSSKIAEIAENSLHGKGTAFVIGVSLGDDAFNAGYVQYARDVTAKYYHSNPQVYKLLEIKYPGVVNAQRDAALRAINMRALQGPIASGTPFKYSLHALQTQDAIENEIAAIRIIENNTNWEPMVEDLLGRIPARMYEVDELIRRGYAFDDSVDFLSSKIIDFI